MLLDPAAAKRPDLPRRALWFAPPLAEHAPWLLALVLLMALAGWGSPGPIDYRPGPYDNCNHGPGGD